MDREFVISPKQFLKALPGLVRSTARAVYENRVWSGDKRSADSEYFSLEERFVAEAY